MTRNLLPLVAALAATAFVACSSAPHVVGTSSPKEPRWLGDMPFQKGGKRYYIGRASGSKAVEHAYEIARADALRTLVQDLGVTVAEDSTAMQQEKDGEYSYNVELKVTTTSKPVKIRQLAEVDRYHEVWSRSDQEVDAWVLVAVPEEMFRRALREMAGKVLFVWECNADPRIACPNELMDGIKTAVTEAGLMLIPEVALGPITESAATLGQRRDAAYVLSVKVAAEFLSSVDGEFFASGTGSAQLIETGDGKTLKTADVALKGGHFSKVNAVKTAVKQTVHKLTDAIGHKLAE
jgi:hypothetical protein